MMADIPQHITRFISTSIESVPFIEALLLIYRKSGESWDASKLSKSLFIDLKQAERLIERLRSANFITKELNRQTYILNSSIDKTLLSELNDVYSKNLVEVTNLIHKRTEASKFSDAFKLK